MPEFDIVFIQFLVTDTMTFQKQKLCYVLPEFKKDDATHFSHIHDFLKGIAQKFDLYLLIEKGELPDDNLGCDHARVLIFKWLPLRLLETLCMMFLLRMHGYRNVYIHYSFLAAFLASLIIRPTGGKVFYWNCGEPWKYKRSAIRDFFENKTYKIITYLITGSESIAQRYANHYKILIAKIKVIPNWIDTKRFHVVGGKDTLKRELGLPLDKKIILFVHHLSPRKGAHHILPIARELFKIRQDVFFVVVGSGPYDKTIRSELAADTTLSKIVCLEGEVPNTKIPTYFFVADVFFMPSEEEGFPHVLLEAMSLGTLFIASDIGAVKEITPKTMHQYILKQSDVPGFARALHKILNQPPSVLAQLSTELKSLVARYDISIVMEKFTKLFV